MGWGHDCIIRPLLETGCIPSAAKPLSPPAGVGLRCRLAAICWTLQYFHFTIDAIAQATLGDFQVIEDLHAQPDSRAGAEVARQKHGGIDRDCALSIDDLDDANGSDADVMRQAISAQTERLHEIFEKDFTRMDGREFNFHGGLPLPMVINDLDVSCLVGGPLEANAPLVGDADAVLTSSIALELLELIARRSQQVLKVLGVIEEDLLGPVGCE